MKQVEDLWRERAAAQRLKPGTRTYLREQGAFFSGAAAAIHAMDDTNPDPTKLSPKVPVWWIIAILSGRDITAEEKK